MLQEQLKKIEPLDAGILALMEDDKDATEEDMANKIKESSQLVSQLRMKLTLIKELLTVDPISPPILPQPYVIPSQQQIQPVESSAPKTKARLPKQEVQKFDRKLHEWQEFWDSFESTIHRNDSLDDVDKFSYLKELLVAKTRSAITGFALTSTNYESAVELLKKWCGKRTAIQRAHVNELLNVQPVFNERDVPQLRSLYDFLERKYRALQAHGMDKSTYSAIVVPSVLEKLPHPLRLKITRGKEHQLWNLKDLLEALGDEVELREEYNDSTRQSHARDSQKRNDLPTTTMYVESEKQMNCAFCLRGHQHEECRRIQDVEERKKLLIKFGRCFRCLRKGHLAKDCSNRKVVCKYCSGKYHSALCIASQGNVEMLETQRVPGNVEPVGIGNSMHVGTGNSVALQTTKAQIVGKGSLRVRVLFDTASHKSFVTSQVVKSFKLKTLRWEWLTVNTFGQRATGSNLRDVVGIYLTPVGGGKVLRVEAYVVPEISRVHNEHLEIAH